MEKRDILDYLGNKIGELELPEGTEESIWIKKLSLYSQPPIQQNIASVTSRQIRLQIVLAGLSLQNITDAISQLPEPDKSLALIEWEYATQYDRNHALVDTVGLILGLNSQQLDELWKSAAGL